MNIKDSVFLISGGASGLGAATAKMIVENGGKVVLADMNRDVGIALASEFGPSALFVATDVTDENACQSAIDMTVAHFGALHGLVCCAGVAPGERVLGRRGRMRFSRSPVRSRSTSSEPSIWYDWPVW